ncbi:DUF4880 domain-containing protein [Pigmentiphaga aceris]|uniref:DUF4880 domain-containing protein n=2 Tax=Pigmentiphaga aceris TaxID=1940612 RepID=A0A5C0B8A5_9BURK|nr:DUF4880 domain-containing protein [Pigmentiphaga aceris]
MWLLRQQDGWSTEDAAACEAWLQTDPAHRRAFDRLRDVCQTLAQLPADRVGQLRKQIAPPAVRVSPRPVGVRRQVSPKRRALPYALAALGLVAIVGGGGWLRWSHLQNQPIFVETYATARGQQLSVTLPDGSSLQLDTATTTAVSLYRHRREVRLLEGQALFTVTPDAAKPFEVDAGPLRATVVGTRFSVRHTHAGLGGDGVTVTVDEGRVHVSSRADTADGKAQPMVALNADESVHSDAAGRLGPRQALPARTAMLWREGRVNLNNVPLSQALAEFERYGDTRLRLDPAVAGLRISGSFELEQAGAFAKALPRVLPVRLRAREGATEIVPAN